MRVTIGNSVCRLEGFTSSQFHVLRKKMSYTIGSNAAYFSGNRVRERYLLSARGEFPTGLLYLVQDWERESDTSVEYEDTRIKPKPREGLFTLSPGKVPYPEQQRAAEAAEIHSRGIITAPTGAGKSLIATLIVNRLQVPTLIVVPTLELKRQLTESMVEAFGVDRVGPLGSPLAIENVDALSPKKPLKGYDAVIIDEFHRAGSKTYRMLNARCWNDVYFKLGLTATPFRSSEDERLLLEGVLSQVIYRLDYHHAVSRGYIVPLEAYYVEVPKTVTNATTWAGVYDALVVKNSTRNGIIQRLVQTLTAAGKATLTLVKKIEHGNRLGGPFANGQGDSDPDLIRRFSNRNGDVLSLTATTGVCGEGVDTRAAEYVIIAGLGEE